MTILIIIAFILFLMINAFKKHQEEAKKAVLFLEFISIYCDDYTDPDDLPSILLSSSNIELRNFFRITTYKMLEIHGIRAERFIPGNLMVMQSFNRTVTKLAENYRSRTNTRAFRKLDI